MPLTTIGRALPLAIAALTLAACESTSPPTTGFLPSSQLAYPLAEGPEVTVELDQTLAEARPFVEQVAARCWLDGVVQADAMIVDRATGRIVLTGPSEDLAVVDFIPTADAEALARMRLSGAVLTNKEKTERMLEHLERAERTGEIACPAIDPEKPVISPPA